jgi:hypothetical protein
MARGARPPCRPGPAPLAGRLPGPLVHAGHVDGLHPAGGRVGPPARRPIPTPRPTPGGRLHGHRLDPALADIRGLQRTAAQLGILRRARAPVGGRRRICLGLRHDLARPLRDGRAPRSRAPAHTRGAAGAASALARHPTRDGGRQRLHGRAAAPAGRRAAVDLRFRLARLRPAPRPPERAGGASVNFGVRRAGDRPFVRRWLAAGIVCGILWEFWNHWALAKWRYVGVPVFPSVRLFEMPLAGYLGFPPFALEVFAMYHLVRPLAGRLDGNALEPGASTPPAAG